MSSLRVRNRQWALDQIRDREWLKITIWSAQTGIASKGKYTLHSKPENKPLPFEQGVKENTYLSNGYFSELIMKCLAKMRLVLL